MLGGEGIAAWAVVPPQSRPRGHAGAPAVRTVPPAGRSAGCGASPRHTGRPGAAPQGRTEPRTKKARATVDYDGDGIGDLAAGTPRASGGAGSVTVVPGGPQGPLPAARLTLTQDTPGILDSTGAGDRVGSSVSLADLSGSGRAGLLLGAEGEDDGDGLVLYIPVHSTGFGLPQTVALRAATPGTPAGAGLGQTLTP